MTQPHSDDNQTSWTAPHSDDTEHSFQTAPPSDGGTYKGGADAPLPPGGLPLLDGKYVAQERYAGGMGVVYKCVKRSTGQVVALKTVLSEGPMSEDEIKTMRRNYDRVHSLSHDHIVRVNALEVDERKSQWYVEMDWVEGENLKEHLRKFGGDKRQEAIRILRQVAEALDYAHAHGVIHRDVKDANIMIKKETGDVVLIDFGIASRAPRPVGQNGTVSHDVTATTTTASVFAGTSGYQSPEQWLGEHAEASSDEYSLAVTAYRCLSGHLPFWSSNEGELQEMVLHYDMPSLMALPEEANAVLKKGLAKKPSGRYATCKAFMDALEKGLSSLAGGSMKEGAKAAGTEKDASFSMTEFYILSGDMEERLAESGKRKWDRGQTFGDHLDAFSKAMRGAKAATVNKDYSIAYNLFKQAESEWKWLEVNEPKRKSAAAAREKAIEAASVAASASAAATDNAPMSPRAKKFVVEHPFVVPSIQGSGACGRIIEADVEAAYRNSPKQSSAAIAMLADGVAAPVRSTAEKTEAGRLAAAEYQQAVKLLKTAESDFESGRFGDSERRFIGAEKAFTDASERALKAKQIEKLEKSISTALDAKRFDDARHNISELGKLDAAKATSWVAASERAETDWKRERISELEESIRKGLDAKRFEDARHNVGELGKLDAAKAASWAAASERAETDWKRKRISELEESIRKALDAKRLSDARCDVGILSKLDAAKAVSWEAAVKSAYKAKRIVELEKSIPEALAKEHFENARRDVGELGKLDTAKAASWEAAVESASKSKRIVELEKIIPEALEKEHFEDARRYVSELSKLDAAKAESWEADVNKAERHAAKIKRWKLIGVMIVIAMVIVGLAILFKPYKPEIPIISRIGEDYLVTLKPGVELKLVKVDAGSFTMGSPENESGREDDETLHKVTLTKDFWLGETEVTQAQYKAVMGVNPSYFKKGGDYPVERVSWNDAEKFCETLNRLCPGYHFSLPTEAQWEYAARGGKKTKGFKYSGSNSLDEVGWYGDNSSVSTHPVRQKKPNELGLYDMSGNVWEWCRDRLERYPNGGVAADPKGPSEGSGRVCRGGSWDFRAACCRSAHRCYDDPSSRYDYLGFRVALVPMTSIPHLMLAEPAP